jgi:hypothetical protein
MVQREKESGPRPDDNKISAGHKPARVIPLMQIRNVWPFNRKYTLRFYICGLPDKKSLKFVVSKEMSRFI